MKSSTKLMLNVLHVVAWIIFVGLSIEAGSFLVNAFFALFNPAVVKHLWLWQEVDLSGLLSFDPVYYFIITLSMAIVTILKACLFYLIIKLLYEKKINIAQPFSKESGRFIASLSYVSLIIGVFSIVAVKQIEWLVRQGVKMPEIQYLKLGGADVWLFMGVILLVITQVFKRGIEMQEENDLTV